ncbi:MAG: peptidoglycan editing factor PgeF [Burkholderiaceae bacterium]
MTTRAGGVSCAPFDRMNLRLEVGDDPQAVAANRTLLAVACAAHPVWLDQVHGARVVRLRSLHGIAEPADASVTTEPGIACVVQVADCLPVLFAADGAQAAVGAAHAGWRGLAGGVLEATLAAVCEAAGCTPDRVRAWLGAGIGPQHFEVGADVLAAFDTVSDPARARRFTPRAAGKWLADLPGLARDRLRAAGVERISGGAWCTYADASRFFSFRRDRVTGRMAAAVWIERDDGR